LEETHDPRHLVAGEMDRDGPLRFIQLDRRGPAVGEMGHGAMADQADRVGQGRRRQKSQCGGNGAYAAFPWQGIALIRRDSRSGIIVAGRLLAVLCAKSTVTSMGAAGALGSTQCRK